MKRLLSLLLVSILGGAITLGAYKLYFEKPVENPNVLLTGYSPNTVKTNLVSTANSGEALPNVDLTAAAESTINTVVHVKNTAVAKSSSSSLLEFLYGFGGAQERERIGTGSGVIISPDGYIVTNNHVIQDAKEISITLNDNREFKAKLIGSDLNTDIALIKIEAGSNLPYITFADSDNTRIGEWVLAVGNPYNLNSTVTAGIISAKARSLGDQTTIQSFIQTDAAVNPGNSGGALVNTRGELIGINTAITSQTGSYIGYSFAVPSNIARKVVEDLIEFGNVQRAILGVTGGEVNSKVAEQYGLNETEGFYVDSVEPGSGAQKAGLLTGDVIVKLDEIKISKFADLSGYLNTKRPNDIVTVTIDRKGSLKKLPVTLSKNELVRYNLFGLELKNLNPDDFKSGKIKVKEGVLVGKVNRPDLLQYGAIAPGYIITAVNGQKVANVEDISKIVENVNPNEPVVLELLNLNGVVEKLRFYNK
ncbi:MAG: Do family serine endopeptidase [Bacteroidetes bacterium]|nr:Do family serine endopeptidase [Bacteroidota bacterium]